jgi:hypothetical protein
MRPISRLNVQLDPFSDIGATIINSSTELDVIRTTALRSLNCECAFVHTPKRGQIGRRQEIELLFEARRHPGLLDGFYGSTRLLCGVRHCDSDLKDWGIN